jgi:large subunit ribosomal protein L24
MEKLRVGDTVQVMNGAEASEKAAASKRGKVLRIDRPAGRLVVEGLRLSKRHVKKGRDRNNPDGGIVERAASIALASVALVCKKCDKPTRVGIRVEETNGKRKASRFCKKCKATVD